MATYLSVSAESVGTTEMMPFALGTSPTLMMVRLGTVSGTSISLGSQSTGMVSLTLARES